MEVGESRGERVIGYWMSEKKSQKLNWSEFAKVCRAQGYDLVKLDLARSLEDQGPFNVIIHKLTDIIAQAQQCDKKASAMLEHIENYISMHPEIIIIDPFENVRKLLDRYTSYRIIHESDLHKSDVFTPTFVELTSSDPQTNLKALHDAGVKFPFVCKPSVANGTDCHKMAIVFNENGLKDCQPPCVAHTFVNHNAVLYKLFIVGEEYHVVERPSLKNFYPSLDRETIHFDSHDVSRSDSSSSLSVLDEGDCEGEGFRADPAKLQHIVATLTEELGMSLLGVDVVVENTTRRHAIIDINAYPGYDGYPDFFDSLMRCIKYHERDQKGGRRGATDHDDSGFETADSSDEKNRNTRTSPVPAGKSRERQL
ncbi:hypothetical protein AAG570_008665 [Ranatra chinensis]|uniref:Inositol-tetrakisphosphate 1-kinase n=1 Tax=Ranatra chinensis TaxID=642074 RepID=A0ABD0YRM7_9HEMI